MPRDYSETPMTPMYSVLDVALFVIDEYNREVDKVFPTHDKDFDISAEDFYITESKLIMLLLIIQATNYKVQQEKLFFEHIYLNSVGKGFFISELKQLYKPLIACKNQIIYFDEHYMPKSIDELTKNRIRDILEFFGGYEEWWLKSQIFDFRSTQEALKSGTFCYHNYWQILVEDLNKFMERENKKW